MDRKEAIEVVRSNWPDGREMLKEALATLIPEFAESKDEKTLEFMRNHFWNLVKRQDENEVMYTSCLVYLDRLEKQKATLDSGVVVITDRPTISKFEAGKADVLNNPEKYGLCKLAEWSDDDDERLDSIISSYRELLDDYKACHDEDYIPYSSNTVARNVVDDIDFLKSLHLQHNLRWRRAKAGENIPESIILPDGDDPRFGKCAVRDSYYIPISELKELPKE